MNNNLTLASIWTNTYRVMLSFQNLLQNINLQRPTDIDYGRVELFLCKLYKDKESNSLDAVCVKSLPTSNRPEEIPPTSDAARLHMSRAFLQAFVWNTAPETVLDDKISPMLSALGFTFDGDKLVPILMRKSPIPEAVMEMVSCNCKTGCPKKMQLLQSKTQMHTSLP